MVRKSKVASHMLVYRTHFAALLKITAIILKVVWASCYWLRRAQYVLYVENISSATRSTDVKCGYRLQKCAAPLIASQV